MTRTQNSFFNILTSLLSTVLVVVLGFITRTIFVRYLGVDYQGIEGEFSNILSVLSLADLGIGSAIVYKLYKPIEEDDRPRIRVLMKLYRQVYNIIGLVITALGLILIPFLPLLARDYELFAQLNLNPVLIFLIYLLNTASSYWIFAYKSSFVRANQKTYILSVAGYAASVLCSVCQIVALAVFHSFLLYILAQWLGTALTGVIGAIICDKRYPWVNEKTPDRVSKEELREFVKDCSALLLFRVHNVIINSSDYITLTAIIGLRAGGLYSNYLYIKNNLRSLLDTVLTSFQASVGSIHSTGNLEWSGLVFRTINLLVIWLYGVGGIGLAVLMDEFLPIWLQSTDFVVSSWTFRGTVIQTPLALLVGVEMYIIGHRQFYGLFRETMGLFQQMKYRPLASILVNLAACIPGVYFLGPAGCVISTIVAGLTTNMIFDPLIIHKYGLKTSPKPFFLQNLLYAGVTAGAGVLSRLVCSLIPLAGLAGFLVRGCVCVALPSGVYALCFHKTEEFRFLWNTAKGLLPWRKK